MKKNVYGLTFVWLLLFSAVAGVELADANVIVPPLPTIYIKADGSIEPFNTTIQRNGNTYTFTGNISGYQIKIDCDNVILDGNGFTLRGRDLQDCGITLVNDRNYVGRKSVTVKNVNVQHFSQGIYGPWISECTIESNSFDSGLHISPACLNNHIINNNFTDHGIWIDGSNNVISGNRFTRFPDYERMLGCIELFEGSGNIISNNYFVDVEFPIEIYHSEDIRANTVQNNVKAPYADFTIVSPQNITYKDNSISLNFTAKTNTENYSVFYCLDGQDWINNRKVNQTQIIRQDTGILCFSGRDGGVFQSYAEYICWGQVVLPDLSNGLHNVTIYAWDEAGNIGASETAFFYVEASEPFPTALVIAASGASIAIIGIGLLFYFRKRNNARTSKHSETEQSST